MRTVEQIAIGLVEEISKNIESDEIFRKKLPYRRHWLGLIFNAIKQARQEGADEMQELAIAEAEKGTAWIEIHGNSLTISPDETKGMTLEARIRALSLPQ